MRPQLPAQVLTTIGRYRMVQPGDRVAVAVSGGGDSVALLFLLEELKEELGVTLLVTHFNHQLRGETADADERFVRSLAERHGLRCLVRSEDVAETAKQAGTNLEEEARERRHLFFREIVSGKQATRVATGHSADDQAETVLARLTRGAGIRGLGGIHPVLEPVIRPLIETRRNELREYLAERGEAWREDETNLDTTRLRARIRRRVLPGLEDEFGGGVTERLARLADVARNDEALLDAFVEQRFESIVRRSNEDVVIRAHDLANPWPDCGSAEVRQGLAARLARRAAQEVRQNLRGLTFDHIARVIDLAREGSSGSRVDLPGGLWVERVLNDLVFSAKGGGNKATERATCYAYAADPWGDGEAVVEIAETGKRVHLKLIDWPALGSETYREALGALDADQLTTPLVVRNWLPGDAYRPHGRRHVEKLKRLLLERRIVGKDRGAWPVLTSAGNIVWSSGLPVAEGFAAGPRTRQALLVSEEKSE